MDDKIERWADDIDDNQKPLAENSNPNEIDMECDFYDEDDDSFGGISSTPSKTINATNKNNNVNDNLDETINDRCVNQKTGIIINLNDDDESEFSSNSRHNHLNFDGALESKPIIANEAQDAFRNQTYNDDYSGINEIDMECEFGDEDDYLGTENDIVTKPIEDELDIEYKNIVFNFKDNITIFINTSYCPISIFRTKYSSKHFIF